ncbi:uncharacterized protein LOC130895510 isoform X1 [Diorhabda carinulata]|uniref:uncharacterized protein LOC130895510 isoform X1 n=1 Tax=Diorhabda carinulata TaxID=1163345 RepID=UPI00259FEDF8|nr:uncharacterized protein LOC130895510 isoform X1 [Diorhabda carinulata]
MPQHKTVEETATTAEENPVEEAATVAKTVKNSESGNILDIFNPNKKGTATGDDQQQPANIFDLFKPKTDDAGNDQKKVDTDSKDADTKPFGLDEFLDKITLVKPRKITSDNSVKTHDDTKIEGNENDDLTIIDDLADALKREKGSKKTNGNSSKNTDDKKTDVKPLFPSDDPFNLKKTIEDAQQAMKEKGLGGLIQSVQQNVQQELSDLADAPELARLKQKEIPELIGLYFLSLVNMGMAIPGLLFVKINNARMKDNIERALAPFVIKPSFIR